MTRLAGFDFTAVGRAFGGIAGKSRWRLARRHPAPDPFAVLEMQLRLGALATELRSLEAVNADRIFYARAHRIHTRLQAYDQLLAEACKLANVPIEGIDRESGSYPSEDERFRAEIELAARGWHW